MHELSRQTWSSLAKHGEVERMAGRKSSVSSTNRRLSALLAFGLLAIEACSGSATASLPGQSSPVSSPSTASQSPVSQPAADCHLQAGGRLPDPVCSPGALNSDVTPDPAVLGRTICKAGWTSTVRPKDSAGLKRQVLLRYGIEPTRLNLARYEMDHRLALEVGGAPRDLANLWPEPWEADSQHPEGIAPPGTGAQSKDRIEDRIRAAICNGRLSLQQGQRVFLGDWWRA